MQPRNLILLLTIPLTLAATGEGCAQQQTHGPKSVVGTATAVTDGQPEWATVRQAVARSLPYLERDGVAWMAEQKCVSCHQIPMLIWGFQAAADHGLAVDEAKLDAWTAWTLERSRGEESNNHDGIDHLILGRPRRDAGLEEEFLALRPWILKKQQGDGAWKAGGQLPQQRRPVEETHHVSTAWSVLALTDAGEREATLASARQQLADWQEEPGESLEWLIVRLLLAQQQGSASTDALRAELLAAQQDDGGWSWLLGEGSDAFGTGQALYALARLAPSEPVQTAIARGREYLLKTQISDGSWPTRSTLKREHGITPTGTYWATGWAAVGLLETLPRTTAETPQLAASH
jgi:squalene-hopene/tetraprenyl-beta-curcumene cyclase